tara:strand:+ start:744 stop:1358 length:615 start_codon:yes stop_codon:yes gene_type:complete
MPDPKIQIHRGTEAARASTLGTPSAGEPIWVTDDKALWMGDGATAGGVPASKPGSGLQLIATTTQNVNALSAANLLVWNFQQHSWGSAFTHSTATNTHLITIAETGLYELSANIALTAFASSAVRYNGILRFVQNGSTGIGPESRCGYIRDATAHDQSSLHITSFVAAFTAADTVHLAIDRETNEVDQVDTTPRASTLYIKRIA